jgi:hypothetical protein
MQYIRYGDYFESIVPIYLINSASGYGENDFTADFGAIICIILPCVGSRSVPYRNLVVYMRIRKRSANCALPGLTNSDNNYLSAGFDAARAIVAYTLYSGILGYVVSLQHA